uniref:BUD13 homolog n=1 Tax=Haemonchus contortus TaxID=6289 RepID=A0A7I4XUX1_HAECO
MSDRTKSAPTHRKDSPHRGSTTYSQKTSRKHKPSESSSTLDNRPEWNNGYDDVDENGRYRRHGGGRVDRLKSQAEQDELNMAWLNSLRGDFHIRRKAKDDGDSS